MRPVPLFVATLFLIAVPTSNADIILDDFSTDQNFVNGKYTFQQAFNSPTNNPNVSGGVMNPNFAPGTFGTGVWLWNDGATLSAVGDKASVTVVVGSGATSGLFVDSDFSVGGTFHEARYERSTGRFQGAWGSTSVGFSGSDLLVEIELTNLEAGTSDFAATISGSGITTTTEAFSLAATSFNFGPVAFNANGSNVQIDDLTFSSAAAAVPEPSTFAFLGLGFVGYGYRRLRRRKSQSQQSDQTA